MIDIPGIVALVRETVTPFNKFRVTSDSGGSFVFDVPAKSKHADVAGLHALLGDKIAISFAAIGAILTNRNMLSVPSQRFPGQRDTIPARDAQGNRLGRLGVAEAAGTVASNA